MTKKITVHGGLHYYREIGKLLDKFGDILDSADVDEVRFLQDEIRTLDVDGDPKDGDAITIYGEPQSEEELAALLKFGGEQIVTKRKTQLTSRCIFKEHENEIKEKLGELEPDVLEIFAKKATAQIEYVYDSVQKIISFRSLDENTQKIISNRLGNGLNLAAEGDIDYSGLVCHQYWRKVACDSKALEALESRLGQYSSTICKTQFAWLEAYDGHSTSDMKKAGHCITELVLGAFGWSDNQSKAGGSPYA